MVAKLVIEISETLLIIMVDDEAAPVVALAAASNKEPSTARELLYEAERNYV